MSKRGPLLGAAMRRSAATSYTLVYNSFVGVNYSDAGWNSIVNQYVGISFIPGSGITVGKIAMRMRKIAGSIESKTFYCRLWSLTGAAALDVNLATSNGVSGSDSWSASEVEFIFPTPYTLSSGVEYGISVDYGSFDNTNTAGFYYWNSGSPIPFPSVSLRLWRGDNRAAFASYGGYPVEFKLYSTP